MKHTYNDGGRAAAGFKGNAPGDCVTRAIAIATGAPYQTVYDALNAAARGARQTRKARGSNARTGVHRRFYEAYLASLGWRWVPTMHVGKGCTVHLVADELPPGRIICKVSRHLCAVIDGVIHDTFDPSERGTTIYPAGHDLSLLPKGAYRLPGGNGAYAYSPERCVYGYFTNAPL